MSKIAGDVALLSQTEIGELSEGARPGKGGSSAMPQKRNPVDAMSALAAARLAIALVPTLMSGLEQEHERALGAWQAEWVARAARLSPYGRRRRRTFARRSPGSRCTRIACARTSSSRAGR